jgi:GNAT superfamily N-acetyltransferase
MDEIVQESTIQHEHPRGREAGKHGCGDPVGPGTATGRRGEGIGGALISATLDRCDREGVPACPEASTIRSRGLYERLGFVFMGRTVDLPDGPAMWPMWREPR